MHFEATEYVWNIVCNLSSVNYLSVLVYKECVGRSNNIQNSLYYEAFACASFYITRLPTFRSISFFMLLKFLQIFARYLLNLQKFYPKILKKLRIRNQIRSYAGAIQTGITAIVMISIDSLTVHCKIYDVKLQKTVIIQTALGVVDIMKHRNFT